MEVREHRMEVEVVSKAEEIICRSLRAILDGVSDGASIADFDQLQDVLDALDYFIPEVLRQLHPEWNHESLSWCSAT